MTAKTYGDYTLEQLEDTIGDGRSSAVVLGWPTGLMRDLVAAARRLEELEEKVASVGAYENMIHCREQRISELEHHLGELLAVMHRDGGHYQSKHGTDKAVADAMTVRHEMVRKMDQLEHENAELREDKARLDWIASWDVLKPQKDGLRFVCGTTRAPELRQAVDVARGKEGGR